MLPWRLNQDQEADMTRFTTATVGGGSPLLEANARKRANSSDPPMNMPAMQLGLRLAAKRVKTEDHQHLSPSNQSRAATMETSDFLNCQGQLQHVRRIETAGDHLLASKVAVEERIAALRRAQLQLPHNQQTPPSFLSSSRQMLLDQLAQQPRTNSTSVGLGSIMSGLPGINVHSLTGTSAAPGRISHMSCLTQGMNAGNLSSLMAESTHSMLDTSSSGFTRRRLPQNLAGASRFPSSVNNTTGLREHSLLRETAAWNSLSGLTCANATGLTQDNTSAQQQQIRLLLGLGQQQAAVLQALRARSYIPVNLSHFSGMSAVVEDQLRSNAPPIGVSSSSGLPQQTCLPVTLAIPGDERKLSEQQVFLRHQIEAFRAGEDDVSTHTRGRNKPVVMGQVGIRCRHCAHLAVVQKQKGSTYFPATLLGLYQAAQNMSTTHMQSGLCREMPADVKDKFANLSTAKVASSGAGRPYWAEAAKKLGFVDTEDGIRFINDLRPQNC